MVIFDKRNSQKCQVRFVYPGDGFEYEGEFYQVLVLDSPFLKREEGIIYANHLKTGSIQEFAKEKEVSPCSLELTVISS